MASFEQIIQAGQAPSPLIRGLNEVARGVGAIQQGRQRVAQQDKIANNRKAYQLLGEAFSDDSDNTMTAAKIQQARQLAPDLVFEVEQVMRQQDAKTQAIAGKSGIEREKLHLRKLELEARSLDRQLKEETNELKREEIKNKIKLQEQKIEESQKETAAGEKAIEASRKSTIELVDRMLKHPGLDAAVGGSSLLPTRPGSNAADFESLLETLKGRQFLNEVQKMRGQGSLSDAEGRKIAAAAEALSLSQSEREFKRALQRIKDGLETAKQPGAYNNESDDNPENIVMWDDL